MAKRILNVSDTTIKVCDERGAGHANHRYEIFSNATDELLLIIKFQNGPIQEEGVNGVQNEDLLAIVIDRLVSFQTGDYDCRENEVALHACIDAISALRLRTAKRQARGVEGQSKQ